MLPIPSPSPGEVWAILPDRLRWLSGLASLSFDDATIATLQRDAADLTKRAVAGAMVRDVAGLSVWQTGSVAVVPMFGAITQRANWLTRYGLATSTEQFASANEVLAADPSVSAIVWDVDSPGGSVAGVPEAADRLFALRSKKRTVAVSNTLNASAAYWLSSAATEVVVTPSSLTGSIGVLVVHEDQSGANAKLGLKITYIYAGKLKVDGNPDSPLSDTASASLQQTVNDYYSLFTKAVARHRKTSESAVRSGYGEGDVLTANRAVTARLADRVETLSQVLARLTAKPVSAGLASAMRRQQLAAVSV